MLLTSGNKPFSIIRLFLVAEGVGRGTFEYFYPISTRQGSRVSTKWNASCFFISCPIFNLDLSKNWKICRLLGSGTDMNLWPHLVPVNPDLRDHVSIRRSSAFFTKTEKNWFQISRNHSRSWFSFILSPSDKLSEMVISERFPALEHGPKDPDLREPYGTNGSLGPVY